MSGDVGLSIRLLLERVGPRRSNEIASELRLPLKSCQVRLSRLKSVGHLDLVDGLWRIPGDDREPAAAPTPAPEPEFVEEVPEEQDAEVVPFSATLRTDGVLMIGGPVFDAEGYISLDWHQARALRDLLRGLPDEDPAK